MVLLLPTPLGRFLSFSLLLSIVLSEVGNLAPATDHVQLAGELHLDPSDWVLADSLVVTCCC
eukprot:11624757-Prorocentrum_lima.AAC.1